MVLPSTTNGLGTKRGKTSIRSATSCIPWRLTRKIERSPASVAAVPRFRNRYRLLSAMRNLSGIRLTPSRQTADLTVPGKEVPRSYVASSTRGVDKLYDSSLMYHVGRPNALFVLQIFRLEYFMRRCR